jgi:hypothetical protein
MPGGDLDLLGAEPGLDHPADGVVAQRVDRPSP